MKYQIEQRPMPHTVVKDNWSSDLKLLLTEVTSAGIEADEARLRASANRAQLDCALKRLNHAHAEKNILKRDREVMRQERNQARRALELIAEDCEAWLASEVDEPSAEFIKLVANYAKEASK